MVSSAQLLPDGTRTHRGRARIAFEIAAWAIGLIAIAAYADVVISRRLESHAAIRAFHEVGEAAAATAAPDQRLWSPERVAAWKDSLSRPGSPPMGILRLARLGLEVPILEGTDEETLNRGAGHIEDTAAPGHDGNCGIAAHRDGFFRVLQDVRVGDVLKIETTRGMSAYRVERIWIVAPEDVSVLDGTPQPSLTLVTCYPFYYVGPAPRRFIVRAVRVSP